MITACSQRAAARSRLRLAAPLSFVCVIVLLLPSAPAVAVPHLVTGGAAPSPLALLAVQQAQLTAPDGAMSHHFGCWVALDDDTALVAAPWGDVGENLDQGSASVFVCSGGVWSFQQQLTAPDGAMSDVFVGGQPIVSLRVR
jgi:hypothetical protein